jgi:hypothetical protein
MKKTFDRETEIDPKEVALRHLEELQSNPEFIELSEYWQDVISRLLNINDEESVLNPILEQGDDDFYHKFLSTGIFTGQDHDYDRFLEESLFGSLVDIAEENHDDSSRLDSEVSDVIAASSLNDHQPWWINNSGEYVNAAVPRGKFPEHYFNPRKNPLEVLDQLINNVDVIDSVHPECLQDFLSQIISVAYAKGQMIELQPESRDQLQMEVDTNLRKVAAILMKAQQLTDVAQVEAA